MTTSRTPSESKVYMTEMVLPQHTNALGTAFGGTVMSWIDIAAAICARRHCHLPVVTASIDALDFLAPVKLAWFINIKASLNFTSTTSCEVGVRVEAENPDTGKRYHTASAYLTMVALDHNGRPTEVPKVKPETEEEIKWYEGAKLRRQNRVELRQQFKKKNI